MAKKNSSKKEQLKEEKKVKEEIPVHKIRINVIGIGGGAGSIISDIAGKHKRTRFYIADTDQSALSKFSRKRRINTVHFGADVTQGMGTGMDVSLGRRAAEQDKEKIKKIADGADLCVIVSCLGGGTGSGAAPVFAEACREMGSLAYGIFTLPFDFERERKLKTAKRALAQLRKHLHAMSVIPNQRVFKIVDEKVPIREALSSVNNSLGSSLEGLIEMTQAPGLINIDFADLETILKGEKVLAYLSRVRSSGEGRVKQALGLLMDHPLYPYNFKDADNILFNISAPNNLSLSEVEEISKAIAEANETEGARIIFGVDIQQGKNDVDITLLGVGCNMEELFLEDKGDGKPIKSEGKTRAEEKPAATRKKRKISVKPSSENNEKERKVRKNALQVQKDLKAVEGELLEKEKKWEAPTFLRRRKS